MFLFWGRRWVSRCWAALRISLFSPILVFWSLWHLRSDALLLKVSGIRVWRWCGGEEQRFQCHVSWWSCRPQLRFDLELDGSSSGSPPVPAVADFPLVNSRSKRKSVSFWLSGCIWRLLTNYLKRRRIRFFLFFLPQSRNNRHVSLGNRFWCFATLRWQSWKDTVDPAAQWGGGAIPAAGSGICHGSPGPGVLLPTAPRPLCHRGPPSPWDWQGMPELVSGSFFQN